MEAFLAPLQFPCSTSSHRSTKLLSSSKNLRSAATSSNRLSHLAWKNFSATSNVITKASGSISVSSDVPTMPDMGVLMEIDGVLADLHRYGHRQSFNVAFQKMGLDCAHWNEAVYFDLLRRTGSIEEKMVTSFFEQIGWPSSLPTNEKGAFTRKVMALKQDALEVLAASENVHLRPGIECFIDEVTLGGLPLCLLINSNNIGEHISRLLVRRLGSDRLERIRLVGQEEVSNSAYGQVVLNMGETVDVEEALAEEISKAVAAEKQRVAEEVALLLKLNSVVLDTSSKEVSRMKVALLRTGAELAGLPVDRCILVAGNHLDVQSANRIGMPCVVMRSSLTARAEFPTASGVFDDFGAGSLTVSRLRKFV